MERSLSPEAQRKLTCIRIPHHPWLHHRGSLPMRPCNDDQSSTGPTARAAPKGTAFRTTPESHCRSHICGVRGQGLLVTCTVWPSIYGIVWLLKTQNTLYSRSPTYPPILVSRMNTQSINIACGDPRQRWYRGCRLRDTRNSRDGYLTSVTLSITDYAFVPAHNG